MPQLAAETFVTQYFWFVAIFILIYLFNRRTQLPKISSILFVRDLLMSVKSGSTSVSTGANDLLKINIVMLPTRSH